MKKWRRKLTLIVALVLFAIIAPVLVLYTMGYRLNSDDNNLDKVGMIIVESKPKDVKVLIDNKEVADNTTHKEMNLTPQSYNIKLTKESHQAWEKNLEVESSLVAWISYARLFLESPEKKLIQSFETETVSFSLSNNLRKLATVLKEDAEFSLQYVDVKTKESKKLFPEIHHQNFSSKNLISILNSNKYTLSNIKWSPDHNKVLFDLTYNKKNYSLIIDLEDSNKLIELPKANLSNIKWDLRDSSFIYYADAGNLKRLNINDFSISSLIAADIDDYELVDNSVIYSREIEDKQTKKFTTKFYKINKNDIEEEDNIDEFISLNGSEYKLVPATDKKMLALSGDKDLYLIDDNQTLKIKDGVTSMSWSEKKKSFLFYNANNIWYYKIEDNKDEYHPQYPLNETVLLTNTKNKITNVAWYPDSEHIAYVASGKLNITELDNRDRANNFVISNSFDSKLNQEIYFNNDGDKLYCIEKEDEQYLFNEMTLFER